MARRKKTAVAEALDTEPVTSTNPILDRLVKEIGTHECMDKATMFSMFHDVDDLYGRAFRRLAAHSH